MAGDGAFHRAPRPLIGWAGVVLVTVCVSFIAAVLGAMAVGFWMTAARGQGVPDFTGGLVALIPAIAAAWGALAQWMNQRHVERRDQIARGVAPDIPFAPSPPLGGTFNESQINQHGGPDTP